LLQLSSHRLTISRLSLPFAPRMRPVRTTSVLLALLLRLVSLAPRSAGAEEPVKSWKVLADRCQKSISEGDYPGALGACEQAYAMNPDPGLLIYIAQIHTALLQPLQARDALVRYLQTAGLDENHRKMAEAQLRYLETLMGTLFVSTRLEGAQVRVDDQVMDCDAVERAVPLVAGAHRVTLRANGATFDRFIFLNAGERIHLELPGSGSLALSCSIPQVQFFIDDQQVDAAQAARGLPQAAGSHRVTFKVGTSAWPPLQVTVSSDERVTVACAPPPSVPANPAQPAMNKRGYWIMGAGLALGGAALATGIYNATEYNRWESANDSLRRDSLTSDLTLAEQARRAQENNQLMEDIQTRRKVAIGLGITGGLVTAGGVALLLADSAPHARNGSSSWLRKIAGGVVLNGAISSGEIAWRGAW